MRLKHYTAPIDFAAAFTDLTAKSTKLSLIDTHQIISSVISATSYCHANNVIVRNLTADNIMVKSNGSGAFDVMICDFSLAVPSVGSFQALCDHTLFEWSDVPYMAPEALLGHPYSTSMDVWSIGVLLYMMVSGELPFESDDDKELVNSIKHASFEFHVRNPVWEGKNEKVKNLIGELLVANPSGRPTAKDVLKNPWLLC